MIKYAQYYTSLQAPIFEFLNQGLTATKQVNYLTDFITFEWKITNKFHQGNSFEYWKTKGIIITISIGRTLERWKHDYIKPLRWFEEIYDIKVKLLHEKFVEKRSTHCLKPNSATKSPEKFSEHRLFCCLY